MHYQIIKLRKFVAILMAISESRIVSKMVTLLVLWAALHLQCTSRYCLGCEIYYICFTNGQIQF